MRVACLTLLACWSAGAVFATDPTPTITDRWESDRDGAASDYWTDSDNWEDTAIPANDGTAGVFFPGAFGDDFDMETVKVNVDTSLDLSALVFDEQVYYSFSPGATKVSITLRDLIQADSGEYDSEIQFSQGITFVTDGDTEIDLGYGVELEIEGLITNGLSSGIFLTGNGTLLLSGDNSSGNLQGNLVVESGFLGLGHNRGAGDAVIEIGDGEAPGSNTAGIIAVDGDRNIGNDIIVHGHLETREDDDDQNELNLEGTVTFSSDTQINNYGGLLNFLGDINESTTGVSLTVNADEPVIFSGASGFTGGLHVEDGVAIFSDLDALPTAGTFTSSGEETYIGLMIDSAADRLAATAAFLALFDPVKFGGTIGFDTDPSLIGVTNSYSGAIDLSGFESDRIGTATRAELTGTITPAGDNYQFGGGGGTLLVGSLLEDPAISEPLSTSPLEIVVAISTVTPRGIDVTSTSDDPTTVYINNSANSFTGTVTAEHSAVVFGDAPGALPVAALLQPGQGGYIGLQDTTRSISSYLGQFDTTLDQGIIGFDSQDSSTKRVINDPIDLSSFSATDPDFYLGTSTWVDLGGVITLPENADAYRFAGYKGGQLDVSTTLTDGGEMLHVVIGDYDVQATAFDRPAEGDIVQSTVRLSGTNTYTGGTELQAGRLLLGNNSSLGTGTLTIASGEDIFGGLSLTSPRSFFAYDSDELPTLAPDAAGLKITNPIDMGGALNVEVEWNSADYNFTLAGDIEGYNGINKTGYGTLNLSGDNSEWSGGLYVTNGTVNINSDTAAGSGPIGFGGGSGQTVNFTTSNPTAGGLYDQNSLDQYQRISLLETDYFEVAELGYSTGTINIASGSTLTLEMSGSFFDFSGTIQGDGSLVIEGEGTQRLSGYNTFTGGVFVTDGANLTIDWDGTLGASNGPIGPSVILNNGSLSIDGDFGEWESPVSANLLFGSGGGEIRGEGRLANSQSLVITEGRSISPGFSVGNLAFDNEVEFGELGNLTVEIGEGDHYDKVIADFMFAETLDITATSDNPFTITLLGEDGSMPDNFDPFLAQSWAIIYSGNTITGFDQLVFNLSLSSDLQDMSADGFWSLSLESDRGDSLLTGHIIVLNFTPVPEPSTFLLVGLGLGLIFSRRPRRLTQG